MGFIYFAVPGGLYFLGNNLALIALKYLSSHLVAMLANFKLLVAAGLASTFLKQKFSMLQWLSLVLVVTGLIITMGNPGKKATEMGEGHGSAEDQAESNDKLLLTILYSVVTACISAVAGVFCEKLYKEKVGEPTLDNVHLQNILNSKGGNVNPSHFPFYEVGKRVVTMFIQPESGTHVSVLFGGNTWAFRAALDEAGVKGPF